jgi:hypothetical protein
VVAFQAIAFSAVLSKISDYARSSARQTQLLFQDYITQGIEVWDV